jgi:hypothetical protein
VIPIHAPRVCPIVMNAESSIDYLKGESAVQITTIADLLPFPLRIQSLLKHYGGVKSEANMTLRLSALTRNQSPPSDSAPVAFPSVPGHFDKPTSGMLQLIR